jgi:hypothetical protein
MLQIISVGIFEQTPANIVFSVARQENTRINNHGPAGNLFELNMR